MRVKILKTTVNNFGIFEAGRELDLPPNMLARFAKETYEEVETKAEDEGTIEVISEKIPVETQTESEAENGSDTTNRSSDASAKIPDLSLGRAGRRTKRPKR